jgi:phenylacetate-CoA ligase
VIPSIPRTSIRGIRFPAVPGPVAARRLAVQYQLALSQWWTPAQIAELQHAQLRRLLAHARRAVPWYRKRFEERGLELPETLTPDFVRELPVLTRDDIQTAGAELHARKSPAAHGRVSKAQTSGSTGRPVEFLRTGVTRLLWKAFSLRDHEWHGRDPLQKACAIRWLTGAAARPGGVTRARGWGPVVDEVYDAARSVALHVATPLAQQVDWLLREQPVSLVSFPSNLAAIAAHCRKHGIAFPFLKEVRTVGEMLSEQQRALLRETWNARLVDLYSSEEAGYLALQCPVADCYHVQSENVLLEIVDETGRPCAPGAPGRVLVTTLHNFAMPLVRYELGDIAELGEPCACGRGLPVLRRIHGRRRNRLILPDGRSEFPYLGEHGGIQKATGIAVYQYQCIQHSLEEIEMKLVADRPFTPAEADLVERGMQEVLGHPFRITFTFHEQIPKGPTGKFEEFISKVAT